MGGFLPQHGARALRTMGVVLPCLLPAPRLFLPSGISSFPSAAFPNAPLHICFYNQGAQAVVQACLCSAGGFFKRSPRDRLPSPAPCFIGFTPTPITIRNPIRDIPGMNCCPEVFPFLPCPLSIYGSFSAFFLHVLTRSCTQPACQPAGNLH